MNLFNISMLGLISSCLITSSPIKADQNQIGRNQMIFEKSLPGLTCFQNNITNFITENKSFENNETELKTFFKELCQKKVVENVGDDKMMRPLFVNLQGLIEQSLALSFLEATLLK